MTRRTVIWDFDGTLARRSGHWYDCLIEILDEEVPGHGQTADRFRAAMQRGFRWHSWQSQHPPALDPRTWWAPVESVAAAAYVSAGYGEDEAARLAGRLRDVYLRRTCWSPFEDSIAALQRTRSAGWRNVVLSNHVPELPELVRELGLEVHLDATFNSAMTGYEKPHPGAYRTVLDAIGRPREVWMVGDQLAADVEGPESVGIPAILVRTDAPAPRRAATALEAAATIVDSGDGRQRQ